MNFVHCAICLIGALLVACGSAEVVQCDDGVCPSGTTCRKVAGYEQSVCATAAQITACTDVVASGKCEADGVAGYCRDGVCLESICGNAKVEPGEVCDNDKGAIPGDGCSADCKSNETCGNGTVDLAAGEQCDDGEKGLSNDGCSSLCTKEEPGWTPVPASVGFPRRFAAAAPRDGKMIVFGGLFGTELNDTLEIDGSSIRRLPIDEQSAPPPRQHAQLVFCAGSLYLFGGFGSGEFDDLWRLDGNQWTSLRPTVSPPKSPGPAMTCLQDQLVAVVSFKEKSELWIYTPSDDTAPWRSLGQIEGLDAQTNPQQLVVMEGRNFANISVFGDEVWVFGGEIDSNTVLNDLWRIRLIAEPFVATRVSSGVGPLGRSMAAGGVVGGAFVVSGGRQNPQTSGAPLADSWSFQLPNGGWTELTNSAAPQRLGAASAVFAEAQAEGRLVTFGGRIGNFTTSRIYEFPDQLQQTNSWVVRQPLGPTLISGNSVTYDSVSQSLVLFDNEGNGGDARMGLRFIGDGWQAIGRPGDLTNLRRAAIVYDVHNDKVVMFGGIDTSQTPRERSETRTLTRGDKTWQLRQVSTQSPPGGEGHTMVYWRSRNKVVLIGSPHDTDFATPWEWDGSGWTQLTVTNAPMMNGPSRQLGYVAGYNDAEDCLIFFGSESLRTGAVQRTWKLTLSGNVATWTRLDGLPTPELRNSAAMTYDAKLKALVLFGGRFGVSSYSDTWLIANDKWRKVNTLQQPSPRHSHVLQYNAATGKTELIGGFDAQLDFFTLDRWQFQFGDVSVKPELCTDRKADRDGDGLRKCADPDCWAFCEPGCPPGTSCALGN